MSNRRLGKCPTCKRELDDATRAAMGLRNGEALNALCPGANGPMDIDHALHNMHRSPERLALNEYKSNGAGLTGGQRITLNALRGDWQDINDGRRLTVQYWVLPDHPDEPQAVLRPIVDWLWG